MKLLLVVLAVVLIAVPASLLMLSGGTVLKLDPPVTAIGSVTPIQVRIENSHGVRRITGGPSAAASDHQQLNRLFPLIVVHI